MDGDVIDWLAERAAEPIEWGVSDCVTLCQDYIRRSGVDPGAWTNDERALKMASPEDVMTELIKGIERRAMFREIDPSSVDGDALGIAFDDCWTLAVYHRNGWWVTRAEVGLKFIDEVKRAWVWDTG